MGAEVNMPDQAMHPRVAEVLGALAHSVGELSRAVRQQAAVLEVLQEGMKVKTEAELLGVSERTVRRRRQRRKHDRLLVTSA